MATPTHMVVERGEVRAPTPGEGEVLVAVQAFGVGIHDRYFIPTDVAFPYTIGTEGAGVVVEVGEAVAGWAVGDRVMLSTVLAPKGGPWAQLVLAEPDRLMAVPESMDMVAAAGIPIAGKTAVETVHALDLRAGETLYVAGASGAIERWWSRWPPGSAFGSSGLHRHPTICTCSNWEPSTRSTTEIRTGPTRFGVGPAEEWTLRWRSSREPLRRAETSCATAGAWSPCRATICSPT